MKYGLKEDLSIALSHYVFRNTEIEDFHSQSKKMDFEFYLETIAYCGQFVNRINRNKKLISIFLEENWEKRLLQIVKENKKLTNVQRNLCLNLWWYLTALPCWDKPEIISEKPSRGITKYIFNGKYFEHCANESILDDKTMCDVNHDICNRIYTLIESGWLETKNEK